MLKELKNVSKKFIFKKDCGAKELVVEIGLVVISVFLLLIFRGAISTLLTTVVTNATTAIGNLFT